MEKNRFVKTALAFAIVVSLVFGAMPAAVSAQDISGDAGSGTIYEQPDGVGGDESTIVEDGIADGIAENVAESEGDSLDETSVPLPSEDGSEAPPAQEDNIESEDPMATEGEEDLNADPLLSEAKALIEGYSWWVGYYDYNIANVNQYVDTFIRDRLLTDSRFSAVETKVIDGVFVSPIDGTFENMGGTDGSYSFTVEMRLFEKVQTTDVLEMVLKARPFPRDAKSIFFFDPELDVPPSNRQGVDELVLMKRTASYNMKDYLTPYPYYAIMDTSNIVFAPVKNKIATLTASGILTAKAPCVITVKAKGVGNEEYFDTVTVKIVSGLQKISVNQSQTVAKKLAVKKTFTPKISYAPKDAALKSVRWSSDNESIAKVNAATGKVTAVSPGKARISLSVVPYKFNNETAKATGAFTWSYEVFVPATQVNITDQSGKIVNGKTLYLTRSGGEYSVGSIAMGSSILLDAKAVTAGEETISWSVSDKKQKAVELVRGENGNEIQVNAKKAGTAIIVAKASGGKGVSVKINVAAPKPIEIAHEGGINAPVILWTQGEKEYAHYPFATDLVAVTDNAPVKWKLSKKGIVYLYTSDDGIMAGVVALKAGTVKLTAMDARGKSASINITVKQPVTNIEITNKEDDFGGNMMSIWKGESLQLKTKLNRHYYEIYNKFTGRNDLWHYDYPAPTTKTLVWSSSNPTVASVSSTGIVKALSEGHAYISVKPKDNPLLEDSVEVEVREAAIGIKKISIKQGSFSIHPGDAITLDAVVSPFGAYCELEWYTNIPELIQFEKNIYDDEDTGSLIDLCTDDFTSHYSGTKSKKAKVTVVDRVSGKRASIYVTVSTETKAKKYYPIENMRITKQATWLQIGKSETLKLAMNEGRDSLTGAKLRAPSDKRVKWSIKYEYTWDGKTAETGGIAVIDPWTGKVTAKGLGYVYVQAEARGAYTVTTERATVYCMAKP